MRTLWLCLNRRIRFSVILLLVCLITPVCFSIYTGVVSCIKDPAVELNNRLQYSIRVLSEDRPEVLKLNKYGWWQKLWDDEMYWYLDATKNRNNVDPRELLEKAPHTVSSVMIREPRMKVLSWIASALVTTCAPDEEDCALEDVILSSNVVSELRVAHELDMTHYYLSEMLRAYFWVIRGFGAIAISVLVWELTLLLASISKFAVRYFSARPDGKYIEDNNGTLAEWKRRSLRRNWNFYPMIVGRKTNEIKTWRVLCPKG